MSQSARAPPPGVPRPSKAGFPPPRAGKGYAGQPKLPRLQPNVNKKAQEIISAHLNSPPFGPGSPSQFQSIETVSSSLTYPSTVPVLAQLDTTAPRTARTHDISHLCDRDHVLNPQPPGTLIDEKDHVYEASFLPKSAHSVYSDEDGMWRTKVFPSETPSSRTDAVLLDNWITNALARKQQEMALANAKEDVAQAVEDLLPILSTALHEVVRQVTHHCAQRGGTLGKIWTVYVELFQRVLKQLQQSIANQKRRTSEVQDQLERGKEELSDLRMEHPVQMHRVITDLESRFTQQQEEYESDLEKADEANVRLKESIATLQQELGVWYPTFELYKESYIKLHVPNVTAESRPGARRRNSGNGASEGGPNGGQIRARRSSGVFQVGQTGFQAEVVEEVPAEVAIAKDFKRLLAVLAPEKRKAIGQELSFIMDPNAPGPEARMTKDRRSKKSAGGDKTAAGLPDPEEQQKLQLLKAEVSQQEEQIRALRDEIARLEAEHQAQEKPPEGGTFKRLKSTTFLPTSEQSQEDELSEMMLNLKSPSRLKDTVKQLMQDDQNESDEEGLGDSDEDDGGES
mmetsp:Transcript_54195/g.115692  ORF Transcript_54195/g.115692 Transcript_54195/m.115692 type:complete len:571 (+) Transcript_54195:210-1922(+)